MKTSIEKPVNVEDIKDLSKQLDLTIQKILGEDTAKSENLVQEEALSYADLFSNRMHIVGAIKKGIPYHLFSSIQELSPFSMNEWSSLLNLSIKSINRYKQSDKRFKALYSEKIIELAEVIKSGLDFFDSMEQFKLWLVTPNYSLGRKKPIELLSDSYGKELVLDELTRIDHGIFA